MTIDFHAHVQPAADHGCASLEVSSKQLELARNAKIDAIVAVSHYYPNSEDADEYLARRTSAAEKLKELCASAESPRVLIATEVTACRGLEKLQQLRELCIEGTNCILIEMPGSKWNDKITESLEEIRDTLGLTPVIAHINRYDPKLTDELIERGFLCQINVSSFSMFLARKRLLSWIDSGQVVALGSDIHGTKIGYLYWEKAKKVMGEHRFEQIMKKSAELLRLGEAL